MQFLLKYFLLISLVSSLSLSIFANEKSVSGFFKHFKIRRNNSGEVIQIVDKSLSPKFSIAPYVKFIEKSIKEEQVRIANLNSISDGAYQNKVFDILDIQQPLVDGEEIENARIVVSSLKSLSKMDVSKIFKNSVFKTFLKKFENKLSNVLYSLDPNVIADLNNSRFFYKRNVTIRVVKWALEYAKKKFSYIPLLNTASFIIVKVDEMIRSKRLYHQNMLLHYLQNFSEEELTLTHREVELIMSSIYESRIEWYAFWESNNADAVWNKYGINKFFTELRFANNKLRRSSQNLKLKNRINFAFQEAYSGDKHVILNLFDTSNTFNSNFAVAFYFDNPKKVRRQRILLELAQLGLGSISLPNWIKNLVQSYMKSFYVNQELREGSLVAFFESVGKSSSVDLFKSQFINPFEK